jgi:hypothetical protein
VHNLIVFVEVERPAVISENTIVKRAAKKVITV